MSNTTKNLISAHSAEFKGKFEQSWVSDSPVLFYRCKNDDLWTADFVGGFCEEIFECESDKFISHEINFGDLIIQKDQGMVHEAVELALNRHTGFQLLYHMNTLSGKTRIIYEQGEGVFGKNGEILELMGFISDITENYNKQNCPASDLLRKCVLEINSLILSSSYHFPKTAALSLREVETLAHLCQGMTMKEIGLKMTISPRTVEMNIRHIKAKLQCHSQSELRNLFYETSTGKKLIFENI